MGFSKHHAAVQGPHLLELFGKLAKASGEKMPEDFTSTIRELVNTIYPMTA